MTVRSRSRTVRVAAPAPGPQPWSKTRFLQLHLGISEEALLPCTANARLEWGGRPPRPSPVHASACMYCIFVKLVGVLLDLCGRHQVPFFYEPTCPSKAVKPLASSNIGIKKHQLWPSGQFYPRPYKYDDLMNFPQSKNGSRHFLWLSCIYCIIKVLI